MRLGVAGYESIVLFFFKQLEATRVVQSERQQEYHSQVRVECLGFWFYLEVAHSCNLVKGVLGSIDGVIILCNLMGRIMCTRGLRADIVSHASSICLRRVPLGVSASSFSPRRGPLAYRYKIKAQ